MRRSFARPIGQRRYDTIFVIAGEGEKTEEMYFNSLKEFLKEKIKIQCVPGTKKTSCTQVLDRLKKFLKEEHVMEPYEVWLVIDKDDNSDEKLREVYDWSKSKDNYGLALSNPKFEYWLLLHFEDGAGIQSVRECDDRLKRWFPDYEKEVDCRKISQKRIADAVRRAKTRDNPSCADWPRTFGRTTVYRLIEKLI